MHSSLLFSDATGFSDDVIPCNAEMVLFCQPCFTKTEDIYFYSSTAVLTDYFSNFFYAFRFGMDSRRGRKSINLSHIDDSNGARWTKRSLHEELKPNTSQSHSRNSDNEELMNDREYVEHSGLLFLRKPGISPVFGKDGYCSFFSPL